MSKCPVIHKSIGQDKEFYMVSNGQLDKKDANNYKFVFSGHFRKGEEHVLFIAGAVTAPDGNIIIQLYDESRKQLWSETFKRRGQRLNTYPWVFFVEYTNDNKYNVKVNNQSFDNASYIEVSVTGTVNDVYARYVAYLI